MSRLVHVACAKRILNSNFKALVTTSKALVTTSKALVTTSKALVTASKALVTTGFWFWDPFGIGEPCLAWSTLCQKPFRVPVTRRDAFLHRQGEAEPVGTPRRKWRMATCSECVFSVSCCFHVAHASVLCVKAGSRGDALWEV